MNKVLLASGERIPVTNETGTSFSFTGTKAECDEITNLVIAQGKNTTIKYIDESDVVFATYGNLTFASSSIKSVDGEFVMTIGFTQATETEAKISDLESQVTLLDGSALFNATAIDEILTIIIPSMMV